MTLTGSRSWTGLARFVPGLSNIVGAAAHLLGHVEGQLVLARVVEVAVTHALPHVCITRRKTVEKVCLLLFDFSLEDVIGVCFFNQSKRSVWHSPMQLFPPLTCMYSGGQTQV